MKTFQFRDMVEQRARSAGEEMLPEVTADRSGVFGRLVAGERVEDYELDDIYPKAIRRLSRVHWTPIAVIRRAMQFLGRTNGLKILDIGSGVGKFCLVGATISEATFTGVEQRKHFVRVASGIVEAYAVPRARFRCRNVADVDWNQFDVLYFYNPFGENVMPFGQVDDSVPLSRPLYQHYVELTERRLRQSRRGLRVLLYHGFGGIMPDSFDLRASELVGPGRLELWQRR